MGGKKLELNINELCHKAKAVGDTIDITGCRYGIHDRTHSDIGETVYYSFLAGLVRVINAKQILEIGTHYGGAAMAMARGSVPDTKIVTIDIVLKNELTLSVYPNIKHIEGDSTNRSVVKEVNKYLIPPIDLIFIDSLHIKKFVFFNMKMYKHLLPKYIVLDDIHINKTMDDLWNKLILKYPSYDLTDIVERGRAGFGIIQIG